MLSTYFHSFFEVCFKNKIRKKEINIEGIALFQDGRLERLRFIVIEILNERLVFSHKAETRRRI